MENQDIIIEQILVDLKEFRAENWDYFIPNDEAYDKYMEVE